MENQSGSRRRFHTVRGRKRRVHYEKGAYATIAFPWDEAKQTLTIGERKGEFPGMLGERTFQVVFVRENHGVGILPEGRPDKTVHYSGRQITVTP